MSSVTFSPKLEIGYMTGMTPKYHATETRFRSLFELCSSHPLCRMMDSSVPIATSRWSGMGTVTLPASVRRGMTI